jgi:hypothetical protein
MKVTEKELERLEDIEDSIAIKKIESANVWISHAELTKILGFDIFETDNK